MHGRGDRSRAGTERFLLFLRFPLSPQTSSWVSVVHAMDVKLQADIDEAASAAFALLEDQSGPSALQPGSSESQGKQQQPSPSLSPSASPASGQMMKRFSFRQASQHLHLQRQGQSVSAGPTGQAPAGQAAGAAAAAAVAASKLPPPHSQSSSAAGRRGGGGGGGNDGVGFERLLLSPSRVPVTAFPASAALLPGLASGLVASGVGERFPRLKSLAQILLLPKELLRHAEMRADVRAGEGREGENRREGREGVGCLLPLVWQWSAVAVIGAPVWYCACCSTSPLELHAMIGSVEFAASCLPTLSPQTLRSFYPPCSPSLSFSLSTPPPSPPPASSLSPPLPPCCMRL